MRQGRGSGLAGGTFGARSVDSLIVWRADFKRHLSFRTDVGAARIEGGGAG